MRHNNKINHLGRTYAHREAMLSNMAVSLIKHKRIFTTLAKAKELRKYIEPLITKSKEDTTHSRRIVFRNLRDKYAVSELFKDVSQKIGSRPGGYTRIIKTGNRLGDNASMCFIELVDYNELMLKEEKAPVKTKTRRSKRKGEDSVSKSNAPKATSIRKNSEEEKEVSEISVKETLAEKAPETESIAEAPVESTPQETVAEDTSGEDNSDYEETPKVE
ncbi:MAG: 50S ribosomal protein L17 [Dysgonamonadaceae bacterium]|jgi:large subunit ribosomal protein L17|nr:50S ribosomal protein L17 [Dysgonamonadaceae bacterium]